MIEYIAETRSTNADLIGRVRASEPLPEGHWLVADRQVAGRGRQGRQWFDGTGNFMGSTLVRLGACDPPAATLALLTGLAVYELCALLCPADVKLSLKWPNDVMVERAKLSGILLETVGDTVVVGIGVNLVQAPALPDRTTAALADCGVAPDRGQFAEALADRLARELERWRTYGAEAILRRWSAAAHPVGTPLSVHDANARPQSGKFDGLAQDGSLLLRFADGSTRAIHAGDILLD
ncbi:biotin--[acetyl-CoA-carboxylase] ligase [Pontixanthobacter sp.]|uniref:biotin--[acetyl-CoA-carboxylase] ligase n=1 Tax=Pontixanthobacter sp. TaxID=2792078 RepID=UPI003C79D2BF